MKKKYNVETLFFVIYAINKRKKVWDDFVLKAIKNDSLGLYSFLKENNERTDGEIALKLSESLEKNYGDDLKYKQISLINWYEI